MLLLSAAIGLVALFVVLASVAIVRRRRAVRAPGLSLIGKQHRAAGVSHLATGVSELSDLGFHLHAGAVQRRRLGTLLGSSSSAPR